MPEYITDNTEISSDDFDREDSDEEIKYRMVLFKICSGILSCS